MNRLLLPPLLVLAVHATATAQEPRQGPGRPEPRSPRRAVVLLRDGEVLEAPVLEGQSHLHLRFPEAALALPFEQIRQVFYDKAKDGADPRDFDAAVRSPDALAAFLDRQPAPRGRGFLIRAFLREDGRTAAQAYALEHRLGRILDLVRRYAPGTEAAHEAEETVDHARYRYGSVTVQLDRDVPLTLEVEHRITTGRGSVELRVPEGKVRLPRASVRAETGSLDRKAVEGAEDAFRQALASPTAFDEYLSLLSPTAANTALLRALLRADGRGAASGAHLAAGSTLEARAALCRIVVLGSREASAAVAATEVLARTGGLESLEEAFLDMLRSDAAWRVRLGQRGLVTLHGSMPEESREERVAAWTRQLSGKGVTLASLWLALGDDARVTELLAQPDAPPAADVLRLLAEAGRPFKATAALTLARVGDAKVRCLAVAALRASHDLEQVEPLVDLLGVLEADPGADRTLAEEAHRSLATLTGIAPPPTTAAGWGEAWAPLAQRLKAALSALARFKNRELRTEDRLAAWGDVAALPLPAIEVEEAIGHALAVEADPRILDAVLRLAIRFRLSRSDVGRAVVRLLARDDSRPIAHAALIELFGEHLPATAREAWLAVVNARSFAPPFVTVRSGG